MAFVISTDIRPVKVLAFGNWFDFKPGQIKNMSENLAAFLTREKKSYGFANLPEAFEDPSYKDTDEGKQHLEAAIESGRRNVVAELMYRKRNLEVSLQKDLDIKGERSNSLIYASEADKEMYRRLAEFAHLNQDKAAQDLAEITKLKETIDGSANRPNS